MKTLVFATTALLIGAAPATAQGRFVCGTGPDRHFEPTRHEGCLPLPIEDDWVTIAVQPKAIFDYNVSSVLRIGNKVKVWIDAWMSAPYALTPPTPVQGNFDYLRAAYEFDCKGRTQRLIQGTYKLGGINGRVIWERLSTDAILEEIEPQTVADYELGLFCNR